MKEHVIEKFIAVVLMGALLMLVMTGCGTVQTLAQGIAEKSLSGSGTVAIQRVGVDPDTKTPVLKSTVVTGDYASARSGDHAFQYRRKKSPSIWNKDAVTEEVTINYIGTREQIPAALELAKKDVDAQTPELESPAAATTAATSDPAAESGKNGASAQAPEPEPSAAASAAATPNPAAGSAK